MLVKSIDEIKQYFPHTTLDRFDRLESFIANAEETKLVKVVGFPLYEKLCELYDKSGVNIENEDYARLLKNVQRPIVQFGMFEAFPLLNVTINSSGGMTVTTNDNVVAASKDRYNALSEATLRQAWESIDYLLEFLERNSGKFLDSENKELWKQSEWYWQQTGLLIFTATEFENAGVYLENKRRKFIQLLPSMRLMERQYIRSVIGNKQTDELINKKMNKALSETDKEVLPLLQSALALYTKSYDPELNNPGTTYGESARAASMQAASQLNMATRLMRGNKEDYPFYPPNAKETNKTEYARTQPGDPFFMLSGLSAKDKTP